MEQAVQDIASGVKTQGASLQLHGEVIAALVTSSLGSGPAPGTSSAELAWMCLSVLEKKPDRFEQRSLVGPAVLTEAQQAELQSLAVHGKDVDIVRFLTPYLARLRLPKPSAPVPADPCPPVLVNSEEHPWLVAQHSREALVPRTIVATKPRKKPDLFHSWRPFVAISDGKQGQGKGPEYVFGRLADAQLQRAGCVREVYEARVSIKDADFGVLCGYHVDINGPCYGMLFDAKQFWLYESLHGAPVRLTEWSWTTPGSAAAIQEFFGRVREPLLVDLLRRVLRKLDVPLCFMEHATSGGIEKRAHLGSGSFGHAFAVGDARAPQALKVILDEEQSDMTTAA